jgi:O-antigen/teichoic acid export membrane protein
MLSFARQNKTLSAQMIRNVVFGGLRTVLIAPIPFLLTPFILRKIGPRGYGTWAIFLSINALTSLVDMGLLGTLSKHIAEYFARQDYARLNRLLNTGLLLFVLLASLVGAVLWASSSAVTKLLFHGSEVGHGELLYLFHCALALIWVNVVMLFSSSVTSGLQRLDLSNVLTAFNLLISAVLGAIFLTLGWGIRGLLYASIASAVITLMAYGWVIRRLLPQMVFDLRLADVEEAKKMFVFSLQVYLTQAASAVHNQTEKLLLALLVGVVPVGWYDMGSDIAMKVRSVPQLLLAPVVPAASELDARGESEKLVELYHRTHKYMACIGVPLVCFVLAVSGRFVELWIGPSLKIVAWPLSVLTLVGFFNLLTGPGYLILVGQGVLRPGLCAALVGVGLNVPLSFILIYKFGFGGALIGTSVSLIVASITFLYLFHRHTGNSIVRLLREAYLKPVSCSIGVLVILLLVVPVASLSWLGLLASALLFGALYVTLLLSVRFFDLYDWNKIEAAVPLARLAKRIVPVA